MSSTTKTPTAPWNAYRRTLKLTLDGAFDTANEQEKARAVREVIRTSSATAAALALQPIAVVDSVVVVPIQRRMVRAIARIRGYRLDTKSVRQILRAFRKQVIGPHVTMALAKLVPIVPIVPDLVAISVAHALTASIGELCDRYFRDGRTMRPEDMGATFEVIYRDKFVRGYRQRRNEMKASFSRNADMRRKVYDLRRARRAGTVNDDEAERWITEILGERATAR